jgi:hypothetical protein
MCAVCGSRGVCAGWGLLEHGVRSATGWRDLRPTSARQTESVSNASNLTMGALEPTLRRRRPSAYKGIL